MRTKAMKKKTPRKAPAQVRYGRPILARHFSIVEISAGNCRWGVYPKAAHSFRIPEAHRPRNMDRAATHRRIDGMGKAAR